MENKLECVNCNGKYPEEETYHSDDGKVVCENCFLEADPITTVVYSGDQGEYPNDEGEGSKDIITEFHNPTDFKFLEGKTRWGVIGDWIDPKTGKPYPKESNVQMDVQFLDRKDEMIGKRLKRLLFRYNRKVVKERVLYFRTMAVEETSL